MASISAFAEQRVTFIAIEGNEKTQDIIILQELTFEPGDVISEDDLSDSEQSVMNLGLFKSVEFEVTARDSLEKQLLIRVVEKKHSWHVLPRLGRNGDGDITLGIDYRANNLRGLNQKAQFTLATKQYSDSSRDKQYNINYRFKYPRIIGTQFALETELAAIQTEIDTDRGELRGNYKQVQYLGKLGIGRWFARKGSRGLLLGIGTQISQYEHTHITGDTGLYDDATVLSLFGNVLYTDVQDHLYSRQGYALGYNVETSSDTWGSDKEFTHHRVFYRTYRPVGETAHSNVNVQVQAGSGDQSLFGDPIYDLSGGITLRGYPRETLEGDAFFVVNTQYLTPLFGRNNVRGGFLFDFGNAYENIGDVTKLDFEYGVGTSLRWKFESWIDLVLRLDVAKGFGEFGDTRVYASTKVMF